MAKMGRKRIPEEEYKIPYPVKRKTAEKLRAAKVMGKAVDEALDRLADKLLIAKAVEL